MPFKLTNASIIFQIYINKVLREFIDVICIVHSNDILIFNKNLTKHQRYVQQILERLGNFELYVNLKKCEFDTKKIKFLNFIIFTKGIQMNLKRIQMIFKLKIYHDI